MTCCWTLMRMGGQWWGTTAAPPLHPPPTICPPGVSSCKILSLWSGFHDICSVTECATPTSTRLLKVYLFGSCCCASQLGPMCISMSLHALNLLQCVCASSAVFASSVCCRTVLCTCHIHMATGFQCQLPQGKHRGTSRISCVHAPALVC